MTFKFKKLKIPEIILIEPKVFFDKRGFFMETYEQSEFAKFGIKEKFIQDNHSKSKKKVLRGLHYQKNPKAQSKIVRCISGKIFDLGVDIRKGSPTFGKWAGAILSEENKRELYIPAGFAHGFCVLSNHAEFVYKCSNKYSPKYERGLFWNDPALKIKWPIKNPVISKKDSQWPTLEKIDNNFIYGKK